MDKSGQRKHQRNINRQFIIHSHKSLWREILVGFFTFIVWIYCLFVISFFIDTLFSINNEYISLFKTIFKISNYEIKAFLVLTALIFLTIYIFLSLWSLYNRKRFGNLNRRKPPKPANKQDILTLNIIDEKTYDKIQNEDIIEFNKNPIRNPGDINE